MADVIRDVVTLGEAMVVVRPSDEAPVAEATGFVMGVAGAESNLSVGLARLAHRVAFVGRVGADVAGTRVRRTLRGEGVDVDALHTMSDAPTGLLVRDVTGTRGISVDYHRTGSAGSQLSPEDLDGDLIASARFLYVTGLTCGLSADAHSAVTVAVEMAREAGRTVVLDPNLRSKLQDLATWRELVAPLLHSADIVVGSAAELRTVTGEPDDDTAIARTRDAGVGLLVVRGGTAPVRVIAGDTEHEVPVAPVAPVDPVGAGDAFSVGLVSGLLDGLTMLDAVARAQQVARRCVLVRGDIEGLPTRDQLLDDDEVAR